MDISLNSPVSKNNGLPPAPGFLPGAERREAERSEDDRSGASGKNSGLRPPGAPPNPEVVPDAKRRSFTTEYKLRILAEADVARNTPGAVGAILRREGLYSSHLVTWRRERDAAIERALTPKKRGPKVKHDPQQVELARLQRENVRLLDELDKARLIIEVQKKVALLLSRELPKVDPEEKS